MLSWKSPTPVRAFAAALLFLVFATVFSAMSLRAQVQGHSEAAISSPDTLVTSSAPGPPRVYEEGRLMPSAGWPVWLKDYESKKRTIHTSAVAFLGRDEAARSCFFLADDVGELHFCRVTQPVDSGRVSVSLQRVSLDRSFVQALDENERWDFEALALDLGGRPSAAIPDTVPAFLSVEGHGPGYVEQTRILRIRFVREAATAATEGATARVPDEAAASAIEDEGPRSVDPRNFRWRVFYDGEAMPGSRFWRGSVKADRGFKGLATGGRYLLLGLEGLDARGDLNVHGSVLFTYDRVTDQVMTLSTLGWGVRSIGGLAALSDSVSLLLDRDRAELNLLRWDTENAGWIRSVHRFTLDLPAPEGFRYAIPSLEGVTVDESGDIWTVADPWHGHYRAVGAAPESVHVYLAAEIPILYRFPGEAVWEAGDLRGLWPGSPTSGPTGD